MSPVHNFIGGVETAPLGESRYRALNPARLDDLVADYAFSSAAQVDAAVGAARGAFAAWRGR